MGALWTWRLELCHKKRYIWNWLSQSQIREEELNPLSSYYYNPCCISILFILFFRCIFTPVHRYSIPLILPFNPFNTYEAKLKLFFRSEPSEAFEMSIQAL